eukprot:160397-Chlamydomonas_euryale.AAC.1
MPPQHRCMHKESCGLRIAFQAPPHATLTAPPVPPLTQQRNRASPELHTHSHDQSFTPIVGITSRSHLQRALHRRVVHRAVIQRVSFVDVLEVVRDAAPALQVAAEAATQPGEHAARAAAAARTRRQQLVGRLRCNGNVPAHMVTTRIFACTGACSLAFRAYVRSCIRAGEHFTHSRARNMHTYAHRRAH